MNDVLPLYAEAEFQFEDDRAIVTELLIEHLVRTLPPTKHSQEYLGEWETQAWNAERLRPFFSGKGDVPGFESGIAIRRFETAVPSTVQEAVNGRYEIKRYGFLARLNPLDGLSRASFQRE